MMNQTPGSQLRRSEPYYFDFIVFQVRKAFQFARPSPLMEHNLCKGGRHPFQITKDLLSDFEYIRHNLHFTIRIGAGCRRHGCEALCAPWYQPCRFRKPFEGDVSVVAVS